MPGYPAFYEKDNCAECGGQLIIRQDDANLDAIKQRINNYQQETTPVVQSFYEIDRLIEVDGEQDIPDVTEEMIEKAGYLFE